MSCRMFPKREQAQSWAVLLHVIGKPQDSGAPVFLLRMCRGKPALAQSARPAAPVRRDRRPGTRPKGRVRRESGGGARRSAPIPGTRDRSAPQRGRDRAATIDRPGRGCRRPARAADKRASPGTAASFRITYPAVPGRDDLVPGLGTPHQFGQLSVGVGDRTPHSAPDANRRRPLGRMWSLGRSAFNTESGPNPGRAR